MEKLLPYIIVALVVVALGGGFFILSRHKGMEGSSPLPVVEPVRETPPVTQETPRAPVPQQASVPAVQAPEKPLAPDQPVSLSLGEHHFEIPAGYLDDIPQQEEVQRFQLRATYPDLAPAAEQASGIRLLVKIPTAKDNVRYLASLNRRLLKTETPAETVHGIEHYTPPENLKRDDLYVEKDAAGADVSLMTCQPEPGSSSTCSQFFEKDGLLYMIVFGKTEMKDWKAVRGKMETLVDGFATEKPVGAPAGAAP